jgi:ribosomal protein S27E
MEKRPHVSRTETPIRCRQCGSLLASAVTDRTVVTTDGAQVSFRRDTDYVSCPECMALYRVVDLREGRAIPVTDRDLTPSA